MLVISSTFTVDPIKKPLMHFLGRFDFLKQCNVTFTAYNQIFQELETPCSITAKNIGGVNIFIIKLDDFLRFKKNIVAQDEAISVVRQEMLRFTENLIFLAQSMVTTSFIIMICHDGHAATRKFCDDSNGYAKSRHNIIDDFRSKLIGVSNIHLILEQDIAQASSMENYYDPMADENGHIPFIFGYYNNLGYLSARKIFDVVLLARNPLKAIILDCDNTLWKGICGEIGAEKIEVNEHYQFLQSFMKRQKENGVLICLCSKNNEKDVLDVFSYAPNGMLLKLEDIAAYKINWHSKAKNLRELLGFLGFSEQSVVFIDDREDECREIQKEFSDLLVMQLPAEEKISSFLRNVWVFDHIKQVTNEDKNRTAIYQNKFRLKFGAQSDDDGVLPNQAVSDVLVELMDLNSGNTDSVIVQRVTDLTNRTNQFNLAKKAYSEAQIKSFLGKDNFCILLADVKDKHGNEYGWTGLVMFSIFDNVLVVDTFLLSCRVIGKSVERVILSKLVEIAKQKNLNSIVIPFVPTGRNKPAKYFLKSIVNLREANNSAMLIGKDNENNKSHKSHEEAVFLYSLDINQDVQINYHQHQPVLEITKSPKSDKLDFSRTYNAAIIDIAKNHEAYLNDTKCHVIFVHDDDFATDLLNMLNKICRKKISSVTSSFVASGVDSIELMMFLAQIYRHYKVKIELLETQELDNINVLVKVIRQRIGAVMETVAQCSATPSGSLHLSGAQEALWLEKLRIQDDSPYNLFRIFYLKGELDYLKLEKALKFVIAKHESLRTAFLIQESSILPECKVLYPEAMDFKLQIEKADATNASDLSSIIYPLVRKQFDLEVPPAMRVYLIPKASANEDEYYLLVVMHHIICDGWSFSKLIDEVVHAYNDDCCESAEKAANALPYSEFVKWQQEQIPVICDTNSEFLQKHFLNYPCMNLPYDFNRPKTVCCRGQHVYFELGCESTSKLHQISKQCRATLYETMLSIYMIFLAKLCDQTDVSLTSVVATRPHEYLDTIGYMVNLITLRSDLAPNLSFLDFLIQTKLSFQKMRQISSLPFIEVVKKYHDYFKNVGDLTRVLFVFENFPSNELCLNNLQMQEIYCGNDLTLSLPDTSKFDLAFYFKERETALGSEVYGVAEFNVGMFKLETIENFVARFKKLIGDIVEDVSKPVLNYSLLIDKEKAVLAAWNKDIKKDFLQDQTFLELFLAQVRKDSHKIALVEENGCTVTYGELNETSNNRALYLQSIGIKKNDIVTVSLERSIEMIANLLAIAKLGAVYLAIDPTYPLERRKYFCDDAKAKLHIDRPLEVPQVKQIDEFADQYIVPNVVPADVFYIVYTSGSTGKPKGVPTTNLAFHNLLCWFQQCYNLSPKTRAALVAGEGFDAFGWQLWPYLAAGATIYIVSKKTLLDVDRFIEFINQHNISICFIPTAYTEILMNEGYLDKIETLEYLLTGGDKLNVFLPKPYSFKVMNHYGVSESAVVSAFCEVPFIDKDAFEKLPYNKPLVGKPIYNTDIYILDSNLQQAPIGVWGELCIGGLGVAGSYLNDSALSANKFIKGNFSFGLDNGNGNGSAETILYRTGDRARFLYDGNIEYLDRLDNQIEIYGYRIEPAEIETLILENSNINQAIVVSHDNGKAKHLVAYVTLKNNAYGAFDLSVCINKLKEKLPSKMIPSHIIVLDELPITENGKVDRASLAKQPILIQKCKIDENFGNRVYKGILDVFSELLGESQEKIDVNKSFFELGGDSIGILRLLNTIKREFNVSIPISEVYDKSSVTSLVSLVSKHQKLGGAMDKSNELLRMGDASNLLITLRAGDVNRMPLFFVHPVGGTVFCYQKLVDHLDKDQTCYGIQYPLNSQYGDSLPKSIQELAAFYINPIRNAQPKGPYAIVGHSFGGMLAYEIAYQLHNSGEKVALIAILDTWVVNVLDKEKRQKLKREIIRKYQDQYEDVFVEDPMAETRFIHMQNIGFVYQPPCIHGGIELFKAEKQVSELIGIEDDANFWSKFIKVNVHNVPGDHDSMLEAGNVHQLAAKLTACISSEK